MPGGFTSPSILFLNTWDAPERAFCRSVFHALHQRGRYRRYVEPCSGAFAMPLVAANAGWRPEEMEASDVSLFSSIVGALLDGSGFEHLDVRVDGAVVEPEGRDDLERAAYLLWLQLLLRMEARGAVEYWRALVRDLHDRKAEHIDALVGRLRHYQQELGGLSYRPRDMWEHMRDVMDDPETIVSINPPTYKAGFEKFFDTKGRLTWATPEYEIFDPYPDIPRLVQMFEGKPALLLCQQQREPGDSAHPTPVFARHLSLGQYVYLNSNRPDEIFEITGGPRVATKRAQVLTPMEVPVLPMNHQVTPDSKVQLLTVKASVADYYRGLWMHRLKAEPGSGNVLVLVDGFAAGVIGYNTASMTFSYSDKWSKHCILRFAFGAPHESLRLTRLATMLALQKSTLEMTRTPQSSMAIEASHGLVTVEMTRHPEAKGLRGLMKLDNRQRHPDGFKLVYAADWRDPVPTSRILAEFLTKEEQWRSSRR